MKAASKLLCALAARLSEEAIFLALYAKAYLQRLLDFRMQRCPEENVVKLACRYETHSCRCCWGPCL